MWKNTVERGRPQMTIWCLRIACWITNGKNTHSNYVLLISFPLQQWLHKGASVLRDTWIAIPAKAEMKLHSWSHNNRNVQNQIQLSKLIMECYATRQAGYV